MSNTHTLQPTSDGRLDILQTVSELRATRPDGDVAAAVDAAAAVLPRRVAA
jgi:hypothetical protein